MSEINCYHSAIAPNMDRCIKCKKVWNGFKWVESDTGKWRAESEFDVYETTCPNSAERYRNLGYGVTKMEETHND